MELWDIPECRQWYERLSADRQVVRYDMRGTGLSQRDVTDFSLEAQLGDVEAVVDALAAPSFDLFAATDAGPVAIAYAAHHPEQVTRLALWCAWACSADIMSPRMRAWRGLLDDDWELMTETCAHLALGWSEAAAGRHAAARLRENVDRDAARAALAAMGTYDSGALLAHLCLPTLVLHRQQIAWIPIDVARNMAAGIPDARLVVLEGESTAPYLGDAEAALGAINEFLGESRDPVASGGRPPAGSAKRRAAATPSDAPAAGLTKRELQVLQLLAQGYTSKEMAASLFLSVRTVERHIGNLYKKIDARGRADATAYALTHALV
jgi:pimeloyl-ACP methyl ester carboxylesterase/DNA-binding CsgD family transcriptional regulator